MKRWHFQHARTLIYVGTTIAVAAIAVSAKWDQPDWGKVLVDARQLYGLWALSLLLASMLIGPLTAVLPWLPFKPSLMYGRRAVGISASVFASLHVITYLWSVGRRRWSELYTPGPLWIVGLVLGVLAFADIVVLSVTSRDASVKRLGGRRWKRLHRTVYVLLAVVLLHALFVGADFGVNRGPDVRGEADFGSLIAFASISLAWIGLALVRRRKWSWTPAIRSKSAPPI